MVIVFILSLLFAAVFFILLRRRDARYLKTSVKRTLRDAVLDEIEKESRDFHEHREKFEAALKNADERKK